ncbi:MAG: CCA tRNA nucleotidyltransferase [Elusimicrobiaceae bacterium]|nr:CCA tRNA nucleotidyltransferase [Elusimicrobiaceae bacterium]
MIDLARVLKETIPQAYYVGGIVRSSLLKRESTDIDLALPPADVKPAALALAKKLKAAVFEMDAEYGVWRLVTHQGKIQLDLTAFQGKDLKADLLRRDFAFNALAYPVAALPEIQIRPQKEGTAKVLLKRLQRKKIIDYADGLADVQHKIIRITNPRVFKEDPLRMLRAFRSAAELGFTITEPTLRQIRKDALLISQPAGERIHEELERLFATSKAYENLVLMDRYKLLTAIFPELEPQRSCAEVYYGKGGVLKHTLAVFERMEYLLDHLDKAFPKYARKLTQVQTQKPLYKMAALLHDVAKPATAKMKGDRLRFFYHEERGAKMAKMILERLHYSRPDMRLICAMIGEHLRPSNLASNDVITDRGAYHFFRDLDTAALPLLLLCWADYTSYITQTQLKRILPKSAGPMMSLEQAKRTANVGKTLRHMQVLSLLFKKYFEQPKKIRPSRLITGQDVMQILSLPPGPKVGEILEAVAVAQVEGFVHDKPSALAFVQTYKNVSDKGSISSKK